MRGLLVFLVPFLVYAQGAKSDLDQGRAVFRSNCAFCHGMTGQGGRGPNLVSGQSTHGRTDADLKRIITKGVPGSSMPSFSDIEDKELARLVLFVKALSGGVATKETPSGNAANGRRVYARHACSACHRIGDEGSVYGPELTRIGAGRSLAYLREAIVNPSADVPPEWEGVEVVEKDGTEVRGVRVNEDTFTVQLRDPSQKFRMFDKSEVKEVRHLGATSLMPAYDGMPKEMLEDLVSYLYSLRGQGADAKAIQPRKGVQ